MEVLKIRFNSGRGANLFFWPDSRGMEIDLLIETGDMLVPVEIKSGQTVAADFLVSLGKWSRMTGAVQQPSYLVYGGEKRLARGNTDIIPWSEAHRALPVSDGQTAGHE